MKLKFRDVSSRSRFVVMNCALRRIFRLFAGVLLLLGPTIAARADVEMTPGCGDDDVRPVSDWGPWTAFAAYPSLSVRSRIEYYRTHGNQYVWDIEFRNGYSEDLTMSYVALDEDEAYHNTVYRFTIPVGESEIEGLNFLDADCSGTFLVYVDRIKLGDEPLEPVNGGDGLDLVEARGAGSGTGGGLGGSVGGGSGSGHSGGNETPKTLPPTIIGGPTSQRTVVGRESVFQVSIVSNSPSGSYQCQWRINGIPGPWTNSTVFRHTPSSLGENGSQIQAAVRNEYGTSLSQVAFLYVERLATAPTQPQYFPASLKVYKGEPIEITLFTDGQETAYLWKKDGEVLPEQTSRALWIAAADDDAAGLYTAKISNSLGEAEGFGSGVAVSVVPRIAPQILFQPLSARTRLGGDASFRVEAKGPSLRYQWYRGGEPVIGANGPILYLTETRAVDFASYTVTVSNELGSVTSQAATLTQQTAPQVTESDLVRDHLVFYTKRDYVLWQQQHLRVEVTILDGDYDGSVPIASSPPDHYIVRCEWEGAGLYAHNIMVDGVEESDYQLEDSVGSGVSYFLFDRDFQYLRRLASTQKDNKASIFEDGNGFFLERWQVAADGAFVGLYRTNGSLPMGKWVSLAGNADDTRFVLARWSPEGALVHALPLVPLRVDPTFGASLSWRNLELLEDGSVCLFGEGMNFSLGWNDAKIGNQERAYAYFALRVEADGTRKDAVWSTLPMTGLGSSSEGRFYAVVSGLANVDPFVLYRVTDGRSMRTLVPKEKTAPVGLLCLSATFAPQWLLSSSSEATIHPRFLPSGPDGRGRMLLAGGAYSLGSLTLTENEVYYLETDEYGHVLTGTPLGITYLGDVLPLENGSFLIAHGNKTVSEFGADGALGWTTTVDTGAGSSQRLYGGLGGIIVDGFYGRYLGPNYYEYVDFSQNPEPEIDGYEPGLLLHHGENNRAGIARLRFARPRFAKTPATVYWQAGKAGHLSIPTGATEGVFKWKKNGELVPGATEPVLQFPSVSAAMAGNYSLLVNAPQGEAESDSVNVVVVPAGAPYFSRGPENAELGSDDARWFAVEVAGDVPTSYQWMLDGNPIPGANKAEFLFTTNLVPYSIQPHTHELSVVARNSGGTTESAPGRILIRPSNSAERNFMAWFHQAGGDDQGLPAYSLWGRDSNGDQVKDLYAFGAGLGAQEQCPPELVKVRIEPAESPDFHQPGFNVSVVYPEPTEDLGIRMEVRYSVDGGKTWRTFPPYATKSYGAELGYVRNSILTAFFFENQLENGFLAQVYAWPK